MLTADAGDLQNVRILDRAALRLIIKAVGRLQGGMFRGTELTKTEVSATGKTLLNLSKVDRIACISTHAPLTGRDSKSVQITMHIFAITDKFQMLLHRMPPVRAFCSFLMQENHADFGCEPPK